MIRSGIEEEILAELSRLGMEEQRQVLHLVRCLADRRVHGEPGENLLSAVGLISAADLAEMETAIKADCESIDRNGW